MNSDNGLLYPQADRPLSLMHEIKALFTTLPYVARICVFGSLARGDWDRWSDIDMIVVTASQNNFRTVHQLLQQHKPIFHHSGFIMPMGSTGWCVLGNVFEGEAIFHCLDLNLMTLSEYQTEGTLERFGHITEVYSADVDNTPQDTLPTADEVNTDNTRIYTAVHFTKKAAKRLLRKTGKIEELQRCLEQLKLTMRDYPEDFVVPSGAIGRLAQSYIAIAEHLLGDSNGAGH